MQNVHHFTRSIREKIAEANKPREGYQHAKKNKWRLISDIRVLLPACLLVWSFLFFGLNWFINAIGSGSFFSLKAALSHEPRPMGFMYAINVWSYPIFSLIAFGIATFMSVSLYLYVRAVFTPLEDELVQSTTKFATEEELIAQYPTITVHENAAFPALLDTNVVGFPVHRFQQTPEQKAAHEFTLAVANELANTITVAHTRAGKEVYFIAPLIYTITGAKDQAARHSFIYTATAGTEPRKWYKLLKSRGYRIRVLNTVDPSISDPWPIFDAFVGYYTDYYHDRLKAEELLRQKDLKEANIAMSHAEQWLDRATQEIASIAMILVPDTKDAQGDFFKKGPRSLFRAVALALVEQSLSSDQDDPFIQMAENKNFSLVNAYTITNIVNTMRAEKIRSNYHDYLYKYAGHNDKTELNRLLAKYDGLTALDVYFGEMDDGLPAKLEFANMQAGAAAQESLGNIVQEFNNSLEMFFRSGNAKMTAGKDDDFHIDDLGYDTAKPTALFIMMSDADEGNNSLARLAIEQIYQRLYYRAYRSDKESFDRSVDLIGDEWAQLGRLENIQNKWTTSLKRHFFIHAILQSFSQLEEIYGKEIANILISNAGIINYIRTGDNGGNKLIAERLGKRANYDVTRQRSVNGFHASNMEKMERIPLLDSFELSTLREGESIILRLMHSHDLKGQPVVQKPIFNSVENGTNLIPVYKWLDLTPVGWKDLELHNDFNNIWKEDLRWTLRPTEKLQEAEPTNPKPEARDPKQATETAENMGYEADHHLDGQQPTGPIKLPTNTLDMDSMRMQLNDQLRRQYATQLDQNTVAALGNQMINEVQRLLLISSGANQLSSAISSLKKVSVGQLIDFVTSNYAVSTIAKAFPKVTVEKEGVQHV